MVCTNCGRQTQNEEANFCDYCGHSYREQVQAQIKIQPQIQSQTPFSGNPLLPKQVTAVREEGMEKPISFLSWLGTYGMFFIPLIGTILFTVMLFVWSFGNNVSETKKNWARATLIFAVAFIFVLSVYVAAMMTNPATQEYFQGNIDFNEYMRQLLK